VGCSRCGGNKQGEWEPVILLVSPKKLQVATVAAEYAINKRTKIKTELRPVNMISIYSHQKIKRMTMGWQQKSS
jgi:hypothetical protein